MALASATVVRTALRTADPDAAVEVIRRITPHRAVVSFDDPAAVAFTVDSASCGSFSSDAVTARGVSYRAQGEPQSFALAGALLAGDATLRWGNKTIVLGAHDVYLHPVRAAYTAEYLHPKIVSLRLPMSVLARTFAETTGAPGARLRFTALTPVSDSMRQRYADVALWVHRQIRLCEPELPLLLVDQLLRLSAATVLSTFPNTLLTVDRPGSAPPVTPRVVRSAREFIEAHADQPLDVTDIARATGVGTRSIQLAFRRHLGITPTALLRQIRLERARQQLTASDSTAGITVAAVARRWGFTDMSRFAGEYRRAYGELPSRTLRT